MEFTRHAGDLVALPCRVCDVELLSDDSAYFNRDEYGTVVEHAHCFEHVIRERAEVWLQAANLASWRDKRVLSMEMMGYYKRELQRIKPQSGSDLPKVFGYDKEPPGL